MHQTDRRKKTEYAAVIFAALVLYSFIIVCRCSLPRVDGVTYSFHCVDFSMGFCSKLLPGGLYNLLVSAPSQKSAAIYETVLLLVFFLFLSYALAGYYLRVPEKHRKTALILGLFYLTGSSTFAPYAFQLGMLDVYWLFLSLIFIYCLHTKYIKWFVFPAVLFLGCMVHSGVIMTYIPFLCLLLLFEYTAEKEKRERLRKGILLLLCMTVSLGSYVYFLTQDKNNLTYSMTEFNSILEERGCDMTRYYDTAFYCTPENYTEEFLEVFQESGDYPKSPYTPLFTGDDLSPVKTLLNALAFQLQYQFFTLTQRGMFRDVFTEAAVLLLILSPLLVLFYRLLIKKTRTEKAGMKKLAYICSLVMFPLAAFGSLMLSTDSVRWIDHGFLCLFTLVLYLLGRDEDGWDEIGKFFGSFHPAVGAAYLFIYALTIFDPYV